MTPIDPREAASALSDVEEIVRRVRQSRIYNIASQALMIWGALTFVGNLITYLSPRSAFYTWVSVYIVGTAGTIAIGAFRRPQSAGRRFDPRMFAAFLMFIAFGVFCSTWLGHFGGRQLGTFWPIYFMMVYTIAGFWVGPAFVTIGVSIIVLTLAGYFFVGSAFDLYMAFVNGGGLIVGGFWMRRN